MTVSQWRPVMPSRSVRPPTDARM